MYRYLNLKKASFKVNTALLSAMYRHDNNKAGNSEYEH